MKRIIALLTGLAMLLALAACGNKDATGGATAGTSGQAAGIEYPTKDITLICPFAAGGGTDALARMLADIAKEELGQNILVVNKTGGSGAVGMGEGAQAAADGYTITMATVEAVLLPLAGLATFSVDDFTPIVRVNHDPAALFVRADSGIEDISQLVAAAEEKPGEVTLMVSAYPTNYWLCGMMLMEQAGVAFNIVPEPGGAAEEIQSLLGGHVDAIVITPAEGAAYVDSGEFRMIGIAADEQNAAYPGVQTFNEQGYNVEVGTWRGFVVPKDTPQEVVDILADVFTRAFETEQMQEFLETMGFGPGYLAPDDFAQLLQEQTRVYRPIIEEYQ